MTVTNEMNQAVNPGPVTDNSYWFGALSGGSDNAPDTFLMPVMYNYIKGKTDTVYPTIAQLGAVSDRVTTLEGHTNTIDLTGLTSLTGVGVDTANDLLLIYDASATVNKKITAAQLAIALNAGLTVGTSVIASGTTTRVLYDNAGALGEYAISGSGNVAMTTSPSFTTPTLGVASATSINKVALTAPASGSTLTIADGKTLTASVTMTLQGGDASVLSITAAKTVTHSATTTFAGTDGKTLTISNSGTLAGGDAFTLAIAAGKTLTVSNTLTLAGTDSTVMTFPSTTATIARTDAGQTFTGSNTFANIVLGSANTLAWSTDLFLSRAAAASLQLGAADAASAVAQSMRVQSVSAGNANVAGADWTRIGSLSTGTGVAGNHLIQSGFANLNTNFTATISNASPGVITAAAHGLVPGSVFQLTTTGTLPTGFSLATNYYVIATGLASGSFQASLTPGGAAVITSSAGSGTHTVTTQTSQQNPASTIATWGPSALTGSQATSLLNLAQVWSTSGTPTGIKLNVTDIASNAASLLMDLQVGAASKFKVDKTGLITFLENNSAPTLASSASSTSGYGTISGDPVVWRSGTLVTRINTTQASFGSAIALSNGAPSSPDIFLARDAANTLAQRNGTTGQGFQIYNTFTDASNYERGFLRWGSNALYVGTENAGTGTARNTNIFSASAINFYCNAGGAQWAMTTAGHFLAQGSDNAYDIGASGATRPRTLYLGSNLGIGGVDPSTTTFLAMGVGTTAKSQMNWGTTSVAPTSPVNGDMWFDGTNFKARVGGATKTFTIA